MITVCNPRISSGSNTCIEIKTNKPKEAKKIKETLNEFEKLRYSSCVVKDKETYSATYRVKRSKKLNILDVMFNLKERNLL